MSQVSRMLTVTAWAAELSISRQAAYAALRRCRIPLVDGLVDADAATAFYRARTRYRVNPARAASAAAQQPEQRKLSTAELLELIDDLIGLAVSDNDFDDACGHIRTCFLELPAEVQGTVRLPFNVWQQLCGEDKPA